MSSSGLCEKLETLERLPNLPRVSAKELTKEGGYPIVDVRRVTTKYGKAIAVEVQGPTDQTNSLVFLPSRFNAQLTDSDIVEMQGGGFWIKCTGMTGNSPDILIWMGGPN